MLNTVFPPFTDPATPWGSHAFTKMQVGWLAPMRMHAQRIALSPCGDASCSIVWKCRDIDLGAAWKAICRAGLLFPPLSVPGHRLQRWKWGQRAGRIAAEVPGRWAEPALSFPLIPEKVSICVETTWHTADWLCRLFKVTGVLAEFSCSLPATTGPAFPCWHLPLVMQFP